MIDPEPEAFISGTLVDEVRSSKMSGGSLVTNATLEHTDSKGKTHRYPIKAWGKMATELAKLSKGAMVALRCGIVQERWFSKKTQQRHTRICFVAEAFDEEQGD